MNYKDLTLAELRRLQARIESEIARRSNAGAKALFRRFEKMAESEGIPLEQVLGESRFSAKTSSSSPNLAKKKSAQKKHSAKKIPPKYANPDDPEMTWTGRGRKPIWVEHKLADGASLQDFLINRE